MMPPGKQGTYVWWVGRVWIMICAIAGLTSLILLLIPVLGTAVTHYFSDGSMYGPYQGALAYNLGETSASIEPNLVNQKYGVHYSLSSNESGTLRIIDVTTHEVKSSVDSFGSEVGSEWLVNLAVSEQGDVLYALFARAIGVYRVTDDGNSIAFENAFPLPPECGAVGQMYIDSDGNSLTLVKGTVYGDLRFPIYPGREIGCRIDAHTAELINPIMWADDAPVIGIVHSYARDHLTGDIYIFCEGSENVLIVIRHGADTPQFYPQPTDASPPRSPTQASMVVTGDSVYILYGNGIYRYSTRSLSAPTLIWQEKDPGMWNPMAVVRTTDRQYWWVIEKRLHYSYSAKDVYRYVLYSDSFDTKLTSVYGLPADYVVWAADSDVFFSSAEGHALLVGSGETYTSIFSRVVLTNFYTSNLVVDPSLPRPFADLWNWRYFGIFLGSSVLSLLSALGVRRRENRLNNEREQVRAQEKPARQQHGLVSRLD